ncbi:unnamed protein product, partial [Mesorhabditis spiculigera]
MSGIVPHEPRSIWKRLFPPLTTRTVLAHYVPASGALSHTMFSMHIFSPSVVSRYFPVGELAVSNTILFNANIGIGFYIFFRQHMSKLHSWERVEFAVFASTMFNFGSLLSAVLIKALLPSRTSTWLKSVVAATLSLLLLRTGRKYLRHIDSRTVPSRRGSPVTSRVGSTKRRTEDFLLHAPDLSNGQQHRGASPELAH